MQKYNEEDLYKSFSRISKNYISILQKKISDYLNSLDTDIRKAAKKVFFTNYKEWYDWYAGYSMYNDSIGIMVYFYDYNAYEYTSDEEYEQVGKIFDNIINIIKKEKLPFKFTINTGYDPEGPIELCIKTDDLAKLDSSIKRKDQISYRDACSIINDIFKKNEKSIRSGLQQIIDRNSCTDIYELPYHNFSASYYVIDNGKRHIISIEVLYDSSDETDESVQKKVLKDVQVLISRYIKFKFDIYDNYDAIIIEMDYDDIKDNKLALKYLKESCINTIFESVGFM